MSDKFPVLYSFRRCPYAMRARLAIKISQLKVELRDILLKDKPSEMLALSAKATVPVLLLPDGKVIDESLDIMYWALGQNDPDNWLPENMPEKEETNKLVQVNDYEFKQYLDRYKYADRFPEKSAKEYRQQAEVFLQPLENRLEAKRYLLSDSVKLIDIAILPFIRQFAYVDKNWFDQSKYKNLQVWLNDLSGNRLFHSVMQKTEIWSNENRATSFI